MNKEHDKNLGFHLSKCCRANFKAVLTDKGVWELYCEKCGECCAFQEEKLTMKKFDLFVV